MGCGWKESLEIIVNGSAMKNRAFPNLELDTPHLRRAYLWWASEVKVYRTHTTPEQDEASFRAWLQTEDAQSFLHD